MSFFAGMLIGMIGGCAMGIVIMCLVAAGRCNDCVVTLSREWKQLKKEGTIDG